MCRQKQLHARTVVQAMARHRIARVPFVGATRATVQARAQRVARQQRHRGAAWVHEAQDIYIDLARQQGGLGAAWAAA